MAAPAVGAARGFLQAYEERLRSKVQNVDDGLTVNMARYAQAVAQVDSVYAALTSNARRLRCRQVQEVSEEERARCRRDQAFTAQTCRKTVSMLYEECGGSGLYERSEPQRLWRDTNAAAAHHGLTRDAHAVTWTKGVLGLPTGPVHVFTR
jgi:3-hydroxy-9,10-secoandrosta-1,3,5(10)-triene-9,17-dione monooxygenase